MRSRALSAIVGMPSVPTETRPPAHRHKEDVAMTATAAATTEQNKAVVRRFFEAFAADDQAALSELLAPDLVAYSHGAPGPQGREAHLQGIRTWNAAFNTRFTIDEQIAEGDSVATRVTMRSVHSRG